MRDNAIVFDAMLIRAVLTLEKCMDHSWVDPPILTRKNISAQSDTSKRTQIQRSAL